MSATAGDIKKGDFLKHQGEIWQVVKTDFNFQGRGMATVRIRIKSVASGKNIQVGYKSTDGVEEVNVSSVKMQYLYKDSENLYFMDDAYNQHAVSLSVVGEMADYLREGESYYTYVYENKPISVRPPGSVKLKIIETEDAVKGDTVSGAKKKAKVETGVTVMVPLFIKKGEMIVVNPETGEYVERVKS